MRLSPQVFALAVACGLACPAAAQTYPVKPIRLVVGTAPGGGTDFVARLMGGKLTEALGQQVIVENRAGAGSTLGYEYGIRAAPDGYTLTMITGSYAINPSLYPLKFDAGSDYTPVVIVARGPYVVVVHPSLPVKSMRELIALAKARPGQITYGSSGQGAIVHLTTELFLYMAGVQMTHVPYKGGGPAMTDLIAGQIQLVFATSQVGLPQAKAGRLRALAVTTPERIAAEPDLPTIAESGVPGYEVTNWHGLIGPKGLPRAVVERLNGEMNKILRLKEMEERMQADGVSPAGGTPGQLHQQVTKEIAQWRQVVTRAGIKIN
jgi:tripartite-type tricarboxylate transporter receptor subunit TctC